MNLQHFISGKVSFALIVSGMVLCIPMSLSAEDKAGDKSVQQYTLLMGHYIFKPERIIVVSGKPVELSLVNNDRITPHNFTLKEPGAGIDLDIKIGGGKTKTVHFTPIKNGEYIFYCNKKLPFMKSHRDRGMEGTLVVR